MFPVTWLRKTYVFNADSRGCRVLHIDEETTQDELVKLVLDDYGLNESSHQIQMSYMFSNKALKTIAHDTLPASCSRIKL